jgi:hypothetical protein
MGEGMGRYKGKESDEICRGKAAGMPGDHPHLFSNRLKYQQVGEMITSAVFSVQMTEIRCRMLAWRSSNKSIA